MSAKRGTHLVSEFETIEYGSKDVRIGDLNGDGAPDILFVQTLDLPKPGTKELLCNTKRVSCLTATTITGEILWQQGQPDVNNGCAAGDVSAQIYDWDNDGENEVLFIEQSVYAELYPTDPPDLHVRAKRYEGHAYIVVLDGKTGQEKTRVPIPAPADDRILFADLTGRGRREDFVLKDGYGENVYGVSSDGKLLWHWHGGKWPVPNHNCDNEALVFTHDEKNEAGHSPAIADVDGDGLDEVFIGFALIDHEGTVMFRSDCGESHQNASYMARNDDGQWRLVFACGEVEGGDVGGIRCLDPEGKLLWHQLPTYKESGSTVVGKFSPQTAMQVATMDRGWPWNDDCKPCVLRLLDLETGAELWQREQLPGGWCSGCVEIRWRGEDGLIDILTTQRNSLRTGADSSVAIYDGGGNIVDEITVPASILDNDDNLHRWPGTYGRDRFDLWGDSREEVIILGRNGVQIHANKRPSSTPTQYNHTTYNGM